MGRELEASWYDNIFANHPGWQGPMEQRTLYPIWNQIMGVLLKEGPRAVIDVGCGPGNIGALLARSKIGPQLSYVGVDFSTEAIRKGKALLKGRDGFSFHQVDLSTGGSPLIPYHRPGAYYVISEFLEHIMADLEVLAVIPEGSRVVFTVPDCGGVCHVRWFEDEEEVRNRYRHLIRDLEVRRIDEHHYLAIGTRTASTVVKAPEPSNWLRVDSVPDLVVADMCGQDTGGQSYKLAKAITAHTRHSCRSFRKSLDYLGFPVDIQLGSHDSAWVQRYLSRADVIHAHGLYKRAQGWGTLNPKARWVIHQHGRIPTSGPIWKNELAEDNRLKAHRVVSTINLIRYVDGNSKRWIPAPLDLDAFDKLRRHARQQSPHPGEIWVAHSPTRRDYKGTTDIIKAVETLQKEKLPVKLQLIEKTSHAECLRRKAACDITYDQMHLCYGNSGLEGMAFGHPTIVGMDQWVRDEVRGIVGYEPFCFATPDILIRVLRDLVVRERTRKTYARRGRQYVQDWHDHRKVAHRVARIYERLMRGELDV